MITSDVMRSLYQTIKSKNIILELETENAWIKCVLFLLSGKVLGNPL